MKMEQSNTNRAQKHKEKGRNVAQQAEKGQKEEQVNKEQERVKPLRAGQTITVKGKEQRQKREVTQDI